MANARLLQGPLEKDLLFLHENHRSYYLFNDIIEDKALDVRRSDRKLFGFIDTHPIPERVMQYIRVAGFGGVIDCGYKKFDHGLITALVERWRPETHSFHLPIGEVTVTLQDVNVLWGLQIEGDAVTGMGSIFPVEEVPNLLGITIGSNEVNKGSTIKFTRLMVELKKPFPDDATDYYCQQRARLYILYLLGGTLFPISTDNVVPLFFLHHLADLSACGRLSWGSAVLASLYRNLCRATSPDCTDIGGATMLLQMWAWVRMPGLCPITAPIANVNLKPYGARFDTSLSFENTATHKVYPYRDYLINLSEGEFIWTPYVHIMETLPAICKEGHRSWKYLTCLVFWEIVELYTPSRVIRQLGYLQLIPPNNPQSSHKKIHKIMRQGKPNKDWRIKHADYIENWNTRHAKNLQGVPEVNVDAGYFQWYWPRTVLYIKQIKEHRYQKLGGAVQLAMDFLRNIYHTSQQLMEQNPQNSQLIQPFHMMSSQYFNILNAEDQINQRPTHVTHEVDDQTGGNFG